MVVKTWGAAEYYLADISNSQFGDLVITYMDAHPEEKEKWLSYVRATRGFEEWQGINEL